VPQEFLDRSGVIATHEEMGREGMAERVAGRVLGDADLARYVMASTFARVPAGTRNPVLLARNLLSILLLPAVATLAVPYWILSRSPSSLPGSATPATLAAVLAAAAVVGFGLALVVGTIRRFVTEGRGTLAPWDPPRHLVVSGVYRRVRNPMISGVILILLGEALAFLSIPLLGWAAGFWVINAIYIPLLEEPMLEARFGEEYREYKAHVPRWVPRRLPWTPPWEGAGPTR
jgi:protein-S-isoprenylcysteine O-methyltransferase Ste14